MHFMQSLTSSLISKRAVGAISVSDSKRCHVGCSAAVRMTNLSESCISRCGVVDSLMC